MIATISWTVPTDIADLEPVLDGPWKTATRPPVGDKHLYYII